MITYWLLFLVLFGVVVFIHELGHFTIAKLSGVFVERFALGFGPPLLKKKWGDTEYAICALPLGGYVKMRGEDPDEVKNEGEDKKDPRSFAMKSPWVRIAIAIMGPISNLILPIILFSGIYFAGMPTLVSKIGWVEPKSAAQTAGLKPGDLILEMNNSPIWRWQDLEETIKKSPGKSILLKVSRGDQTVEINATPKAESDVGIFGESVLIGKLGMSPNSYRPVIGIASSTSPAYKIGLRTGDAVTKINGQPIQYWWQLEQAFAQPKFPMSIEVERFELPFSLQKFQTLKFSLTNKVSSLLATGIEDGELYIREVKTGTVAEQHGILAGDKLFAINKTPLSSWTEFQDQVKQNNGENISLTISRNGVLKTINFIPKEILDKNRMTQENEKRRQFGVLSTALPGEPLQKNETYRNPFLAIYHGCAHSIEMTALTIQGLTRLFTGKMPVKKALGGPISIFYLAGGSYETGGWVAFFRMMALLSITLGVINLLPIPPLDGGHIFFYTIEVLKGSPLNMRARELIQQIGMVLIIGLMLLTFYVDIDRYFLDRIKALFN